MKRAVVRQANTIIRCFIAVFLAAYAHNTTAVDYDNGTTNRIDSPLSGGSGSARVFNAADGQVTALMLHNGAVVNEIDAFHRSRVNSYPGARITGSITAHDTSRVVVYGGTLSSVDVLANASMLVSGGTFTGDGGRAIGTFGNAALTITDVTLSGNPTFALLASGSSTIDVIGGAINGEVRANDDAVVDVLGGSGIDAVTATTRGTITLFGSAFSLGALGPVSLATPFVIGDDTYNGQFLSGVLADGSTISAEIFNGVAGSEVTLAAAPVPVSGTVWFMAFVSVGLVRRAIRTASIPRLP